MRSAAASGVGLVGDHLLVEALLDRRHRPAQAARPRPSAAAPRPPARRSAARRTRSRPADRPCRSRRTRSASICCVRTASVWACSVGIAIASSKHDSAIDCTPPSTAASACTAARTMLFSGCCSVSVEPPVWVCVRSCSERGSRAPKRSRITVAHMPPQRAVLGDLLEEVRVRVEDPARAAARTRRRPRRAPARPPRRRSRWRPRTPSPGRPCSPPRACGSPDSEMALKRGASRAHQAIRSAASRSDGPRRVDVGAAGDVLLEHVVLRRAADRATGHALPLGTRRGTSPPAPAPAR